MKRLAIILFAALIIAPSITLAGDYIFDQDNNMYYKDDYGGLNDMGRSLNERHDRYFEEERRKNQQFTQKLEREREDRHQQHQEEQRRFMDRQSNWNRNSWNSDY